MKYITILSLVWLLIVGIWAIFAEAFDVGVPIAFVGGIIFGFIGLPVALAVTNRIYRFDRN